MKLIKNILLVYLFSIGLSAYAQQYYFKQYTTEDGLASTQVRAIHQDDFGYLWVGTAAGLNRFDGIDFENFSTSKHLIDPQVNAILKRNQGGIWVVTTKGVSVFEENKVKVKDLTSLLDGGNIYDAAEDSEGNLWCLIYKKGLIKISFDKTDKIDFISLSNSYNEIFISEKDEAYISGAEGHFKKINLNTKTQKLIYTNNPHSKSRHVASLSVDTLVATDTEHSFLIVKDSIRPFYFENKYTGVRDVYIDSRYHIWLASKNAIRKINSKTGDTTRFDLSNGMPFESSKTIYEDNNQNIWIGTEGGGLLKVFPNQEFVSYTKNDGLPSEQVMSIIEEGEKMWFSSYTDGIFSSENENYNVINTSSGLPNNTVWSSEKSNDGKLWFATSDGLACYYNDKIKSFTTTDGLPSKRFTALFYDKEKDELWMGWKKGVIVFKNETILKSYSTKEGFDGYRVRAIKKDNNGIVWIGCKNGLYSIQNDKPKKIIEADSLARNAQIYSIELTQYHVAIGASSGLYFYNKQTLQHKQGEALGEKTTQSAYFLKQDKRNELWLGSSNGVWHFKYIEDEVRLNIISNVQYGRKNGISNLETNQNSAFVDKNGKLWFGTSKGLVKRTDEKLNENKERIPPQIKLTNIRLFLKSIDSVVSNNFSSDLNLKYNQNHLTFDYTSVHLENPDNIQYQFMLDGFDENWLPPTKENVFSYTNLPYGTYNFKVKSSLDGSNWSEPATFKFQITPPFWLTKWFLFLCVLFLVLMSMLIYKWRTNVNKRKSETERLGYKNKLLSLEQQSLSSSMNRHFIFNALNSIQYYINTQDRLSANKYLSSFAKLIRKNLESSGSKNNLIPLKEELERVELYLELENMRFQDKIEYSLIVKSNIRLEEILIPPMFFQPFIENSIWHGILPKDGGKIDVIITKEAGETIKISILDDGIGIKTSQENKNTTSHNSRGVYLTKRRIELLEKTINKKIEVVGPEEILGDNNQVIGTKVEILLPLNYKPQQ